MARPLVWDKEKKQGAIEKIIERICNGESCRSILDNGDRNEYPSFYTFSHWLREDDGLAKQYAHACELRAEMLFDEILDISDAVENDVITDPETGAEIIDHHVIQRDRLRVDARKWVLGKLNPKKYGDKVEVENNHTIKEFDIKKALGFDRS